VNGDRGPRLPRLTRREAVLATAFLATLPLVNPYLRGEGNGYYAYVRSLVLDHDLRFDDEYRRGDAAFVSQSFRKADGQPWPPMVLPGGYLRNQWSVGPSLLWLPSFVQAHLAVRFLRELGGEVAADGYSLPYRVSCALATAAYAFLGLFLAYRAAAQITGPAPALLATVGLWLASSLPVYVYFLPFYSHALASFGVSLFFWYWLTRRPLLRAREWLTWGLAGGLVWQLEPLAGLVLVVAAVEWITSVRPTPARPLTGDAWGAAVTRAVAFGGAALVAASPQLVIKSILHGSALRTGTLNRYFWDGPRLLEVGFAAEHGLFLWTPVVLLSLVGLLMLCRREPVVGAGLLAAFASTYYVVSCYEAWHGLSSFGNRFFVGLTPAFVVGAAVALQGAHALLAPRLTAAGAWTALVASVAVLVAWNGGLVFQWGTNMVPRQGPVDFAVVARNQATTVPRRIAGLALRYVAARQETMREQERKD
jgi:hypothetical protein